MLMTDISDLETTGFGAKSQPTEGRMQDWKTKSH